MARFLATGRLLLADDMGLDKATQAIAACHALFDHGAARRDLLVVPAPLKQEWLRELSACCDLPIEVVDDAGSSPRFDDTQPIGRSVEQQSNNDREEASTSPRQFGEVHRDSTTLRLTA